MVVLSEYDEKLFFRIPLADSGDYERDFCARVILSFIDTRNGVSSTQKVGAIVGAIWG